MDCIAFVQQTFVIQLFEQPPKSFDIFVIVSDIWVVHIYPITHFVSKIFPLTSIFHNVSTTSSIVFVNRNFLTNILFSDAKTFFYTKFHRQAVSIPTSFTFHLETLHSFITAESIFDSTRHNVVNTRHTIGRRRSFIEYKRRMTFTFSNTLVEQILSVPLL